MALAFVGTIMLLACAAQKGRIQEEKLEHLKVQDEYEAKKREER